MGSKRITNKDIDQRLIGRLIQRLGDYEGVEKPINFKCLIDDCGHIWLGRPNNVVNKKSGCPACAGMLPITNIIFDNRVGNRPIKRLEDISGVMSDIWFQCLIETCNYKWKTTPSSIINGLTGCIKCAGKLQLTNKDIDNKLLEQNRPIRRIGDYKNNHSELYFECLIDGCSHLWSARSKDVLYKLSGCPKCANKIPFTNKVVNDRLSIKCMKLIDNYVDVETIVNFECLKCNHIFETYPNRVLNGVMGCPNCSGQRAFLTNENIDRRINERNIIRLESFTDSETKMKFACNNENCSYVWNTYAYYVLDKDTVCPDCNGGFGKNEKITYNTLKNNLKIDVIRHKLIKQLVPDESKKMIVDIYIPSKNIIIEYNGGQHYKAVRFNECSQEQAEINFIKQQERDSYLQTICDTNNIKLIWIDGRKYTNSKLEKYVLEVILPEINNYEQQK
jgi:hypothetical protein